MREKRRRIEGREVKMIEGGEMRRLGGGKMRMEKRK